MREEYFESYDTPVGKVTIFADKTNVTSIEFGSIPGAAGNANAATDLAAAQLGEYFSGQRMAFSIPLRLSGTPFQMAVWEELCRIPFGETRSYKEIAVRIGSPEACRAVGMANNRNPIPIIVPCHRVIGKNGNLTGYAGGLDIKFRLLQIEHNALQSCEGKNRN